jgi:hypothetical protein
MDKYKLTLQQLFPGAMIIEQFPYMTTIMDYAVIIKDRLIEVEVKIDKSDYASDFLKIVKGGRVAFNKHSALKAGKFVDNQFYFMVPQRLITSKEIPDHVGLITFKEVDNLLSINILKEAPLLHSNYLGKSFYFTLSKHLLSRSIALTQIINLKSSDEKVLHTPDNSTNTRKSHAERRKVISNTGISSTSTGPKKEKKAGKV